MAGYGWVAEGQMVKQSCVPCQETSLLLVGGCVCVCECLISGHVPVSGCHTVHKACVCGTNILPFFISL